MYVLSLLFTDPCEDWPSNYFQKNNLPNDTLVDEMFKYAKKNLALVNVMIQSPYITKIKRDVAMTFTSYVANAGKGSLQLSCYLSASSS